MVDDLALEAFNDPVLPQTDAALDDLDIFSRESQPFDTIDPSLTLTATPSFPPELDFPSTQSTPCSPLVHYSHSDPNSPCFGRDINNGTHPVPPSPDLYQPRAHSQPPEEVTFHRSGHYLGRSIASRHPFPTAVRTNTRAVGTNTRAVETKSWRQPPYARPGHGPAGRSRMPIPPTSAPVYLPSPMMSPMNMGMPPMSRTNGLPLAVLQPQQHLQLHSQPLPDASRSSAETMAHGLSNIGEPNEMELWRSEEQQDQTMLAMGMLSYVERMTQECERMKELILRVFKEGQTGPNDKIEKTRLEKRNANSAVTELDELLELLPLPSESMMTEGEDALAGVPKNGQTIRGLDAQAMTALLDRYNIPYLSNMFSSEKKALYLRFIGASRALMHRVLD